MKTLSSLVVIILSSLNFAMGRVEVVNLEELSKKELVSQVLSIHSMSQISEIESYFGMTVDELSEEELRDLVFAATNGFDGPPIVN